MSTNRFQLRAAIANRSRIKHVKKCLSIVSVVILLGWFHASIAKITERVQFAKGKNYADVKGITGKNGVFYLVRAKAGQKLAVDITPSAEIGVKIKADLSDGHTVLLREEKGGFYEVDLDATGDYSISVGSTAHLNAETFKSVPFKIKIKITN